MISAYANDPRVQRNRTIDECYGVDECYDVHVTGVQWAVTYSSTGLWTVWPYSDMSSVATGSPTADEAIRSLIGDPR